MFQHKHQIPWMGGGKPSFSRIWGVSETNVVPVSRIYVDYARIWGREATVLPSVGYVEPMGVSGQMKPRVAGIYNDVLTENKSGS